MKVNFWLTLSPAWSPENWKQKEVTAIRVSKVTKERPRRGDGMAVRVSLDVDPAIFDPIRIEGSIPASTEIVQLSVEDAHGEEPNAE